MKSFIDLLQSPDLEDYKPVLEDIFRRHPELFSLETPNTFVVPPETTSSSSVNSSVASNSSLEVNSVASNSSLEKRANTNMVVSSSISNSKVARWQAKGSTLPPDLEMRVIEALSDLVLRKMLVLSDVAHAESYLSKSIRASSYFLKEQDLEKRAAMIINARKC